MGLGSLASSAAGFFGGPSGTDRSASAGHADSTHRLWATDDLSQKHRR